MPVTFVRRVPPEQIQLPNLMVVDIHARSAITVCQVLQCQPHVHQVLGTMPSKGRLLVQLALQESTALISL